MNIKRSLGFASSILVVTSLAIYPAAAANPTKAEITKTINSAALTLDKAVKDLAKKNSESTPSEETYQSVFGSFPMPTGVMLNPVAHSLTDMFNYGVVFYLCPEGNGAKACNTPGNNNSSTSTGSQPQTTPAANTEVDTNTNNVNDQPVEKAVIPKIFKTLNAKQKLDSIVLTWSYSGKTPSTTKITYYPTSNSKLSKVIKVNGKIKTLTIPKLKSNIKYTIILSGGSGQTKSVTTKLIPKPQAATDFKSTPIGDTLLLTWLPNYNYISSAAVGTPDSILLKLSYKLPSSKPKIIKLGSFYSTYTLKAAELLDLKSITLNYSNIAGLSTDSIIRINQVYSDSLTVTQSSISSVKLSWNSNPDIQDATLTITGPGLLRNNEVITVGKSENQLEIKSLSPKGNYTFKLKENYSDGSYDTLTKENYILLSEPTTPTNLSSVTGNSSATITWLSTEQNNMNTFILQYKLSSAVDWTTINTTSQSYNLTNLLNNQSYQVKVAAVNPLATSVFAGPITITPLNIPSTPLGLTLTAKDTSITASWQAQALSSNVSITSYLLEYKPSSSTSYTSMVLGSAITSVNIPNLSNGVSYDVRISSVSIYGNSLPSPVASVTPTASLYFVTTQEAVNTTQGTLINWSPSLALLSSSQLMGYNIEYKLQDSSTWTSLTQGSNQSTSYTLTNLVSGLTYNFRVTPVMGGGFSESIAPAIVKSFIASSFGSNINTLDGYAVTNGAQLYWSALTGSSNTYKVYYQVTGSSSWILLVSGLTSTNYLVTALSAGTSYNFKVESNTGVIFPTISLVPTVSLSLPSAPLNLIATASIYTGNSVSLVWNTPSNIGSSAVLSYLVEYKLASTAVWSVFSNNSLTTTANITGLVAGSVYNFRVSAVNSTGAGSFATVSETPAVNPTAATAVNSLVATRGAGSIILTWLPPTSNGSATITSYYVYQKLTASSSWVLLTTSQVSPTYTVTGLTAGSSYDFKVQANNGLVLGAGSEVTSSPFDLSSAPINVTVTKDTNLTSSITLSWGNPSNNGGSLVTSYQIQKKLTSSSLWSTVAANNLSNSLVLTGLDANTSYDFSITPINSAGYGTPAYITTVTYSTPSAPTNLTATSGFYSLNLAWLAPTQDGNSPITGYQIQYKLSSDPTYSSVNCPSYCPSLTAFLLNLPLVPGSSYDVKVSALNAVGASTPVMGSFTTLSAIAPSIVTNATIVTSLNAVNLSWSIPSSDNGSPITSYSVSYSVTGSGSYTNLYTGTNLSAMATGTTTGESYDFKIIASNLLGDSTPVMLTIVSE